MAGDTDAIEELAERILSEHGYSVHLCAEIEYLFVDCARVDDPFWEALLRLAARDNIPLETIGREATGRDDIQQYECRFSPADPLIAAGAVDWLHRAITAMAPLHAVQPLRCAFHAQSGLCCGLHWHLHLLDAQGGYVFFKRDEEMSDALRYTLGGLLACMAENMPAFAPHEHSYARLQSGADHVPTRICWGGNNRTAALRLPESVIPLRHIEHRVCGADADPFAAVRALLSGIDYGLTHRCDPGEQLFGDARRSTDLPLLPAPVQAARKKRG